MQTVRHDKSNMLTGQITIKTMANAVSRMKKDEYDDRTTILFHRMPDNAI